MEEELQERDRGMYMKMGADKKNRLPRLDLGDKDCFNREHTIKKVSGVTWERIFKYWYNSPLYESFINKPFYDGKHCMACGEYHNLGQLRKLERAHITAAFCGGSAKPNNLHALCRRCHLGSEELEGWTYWLWLGLKSQIFENGTLNSYEYDYPNTETCEDDGGEMLDKELLVPYENNSMYKIKEYTKDIVLLNQIEGMVFKEGVACFIIHNPKLWGLKCEFKNLDEIQKIDETLYLNPLTIETVTKEYVEKYEKKWEDVWEKHT